MLKVIKYSYFIFKRFLPVIFFFIVLTFISYSHLSLVYFGVKEPLHPYEYIGGNYTYSTEARLCGKLVDVDIGSCSVLPITISVSSTRSGAYHPSRGRYKFYYDLHSININGKDRSVSCRLGTREASWIFFVPSERLYQEGNCGEGIDIKSVMHKE